MKKLTVRILMLSMFTTSLLAVPFVTETSAATSSKHLKKRARVTHQSPRVSDRSASPFPSRYEDDFDRRNTGGGGY